MIINPDCINVTVHTYGRILQTRKSCVLVCSWLRGPFRHVIVVCIRSIEIGRQGSASRDVLMTMMSVDVTQH